MTTVAFHTGLTQPSAYAIRLLRKAWRQGARVLVTVPAERLAAFDVELWTGEEPDFLPHLRLDTQPGAAMLARTPIWLAADPQAPVGPDVLVNLGTDIPADPARFERIVEIVPGDEAGRTRARARWRTYEALGLSITHHRSVDGV